MLCKNCVHFAVCANVYCEVTAETEIKNIHGKPCYYFEDKSKYIALPCKVGDRVYVICYKRNVQPYIRVETVLHMNYLQGKSLALWQIHTEYAAHNAKDVIYTKSEAEQKLKEMKENV